MQDVMHLLCILKLEWRGRDIAKHFDTKRCLSQQPRESGTIWYRKRRWHCGMLSQAII